MPRSIGICHVCGIEKPLTKEHVPPHAALNDSYYFLGTLEQSLKAGPLPIHEGPKYQGDISFEALCAECNNNYCNRYNRELIKWIHGGEFLLRKLVAEHGIEADGAVITTRNIYPLRVIKGIIAMFLTVNSVEFRFEAVGQELADLVLDETAKRLLDGISVYTYLNHTGNYRYLPFMHKGSIDDFLLGRLDWYSEITKPPYGFVLAINSKQPDERLCDISQFADAELNQRVTVSLGLKILPTHMLILVCDYRGLEEIAEDERRNIEGALRQGIDLSTI